MRAPALHRAYTYKVTVAPVGLPVDLAALKFFLKITGTVDDALLNTFIKAATIYGEQLTNRWFITRTAETFRDFFPNAGQREGYYANLSSIEIRRSPLQSIESITHLVSGSPVTVPTADYYNTLEHDYSEILNTEDGDGWPGDTDSRLQSVTITFTAGLGDTDADMPAWVTESIYAHVAAMYENRGDCAGCGDTTGQYLPSHARAMLMQNRIENL